MNAPKDDLEAVRTVVEAIKDFKSDEQQRILGWEGDAQMLWEIAKGVIRQIL